MMTESIVKKLITCMITSERCKEPVYFTLI